MTPLIDVIFLLLTFFIYSLVVTVRMQVMPVTLTPVTGVSADSNEPAAIDAITIARDGSIYFNNTLVTRSALPARLQQYASRQTAAPLFIAMETAAAATPAQADRGPLFVWLIEQLRLTGIENFAIVGQPSSDSPATSDNTTQPAADATANPPATDAE